MKNDHVMLRLPCLFGHEWIQAYALVDVKPGIDPMEFRFELPKRLPMFHEVENYLGGTPGDLFIGFFARGQMELLQNIGKIKAMEEVLELKEWAIAAFPVAKNELVKEDWQILKYLRAGHVTEELCAWFKPDPMLVAQGLPLPEMPMDKIEAIADGAGLPKEKVIERMEFMKAIPLGVMLQVPDPSLWDFTEIHFKFHNCTFEQKAEELLKVGRAFPAESHSRQGAIMVEPASIEELKTYIKKINAIPDVSVCDFAFSEDMLWTQPWLDEYMDAKLKECK
jgi:hypothetical protein